MVLFLYTGEVGGYRPALAQDKLAMVWPYVLGEFPPSASTAAELRTAVTAFDHWLQPHPRPYDPAGTAELIGPRPARKKARAQAARSERG